MFARKKRNKTGTVSVQIIDKTHGYRVVQTVGSSKDPNEIEKLFLRAKQILVAAPSNQPFLFPTASEHDLLIENFTDHLANAQIRTAGPERIFGALFNHIGFSAIKDELFRHLTIARLAFPLSKLKTIDYLRRYRGIDLSVDTIYRFMDKLNDTHKAQATAIVYQHTKVRLGGNIAVVFYDMTTLYFEAEEEDDLRKIGFSKDGKFQKPQIMLGLLVGANGLPIGYDIFEGNVFEGHTLLPVLRRIQKTYDLGKPIVVADAGLLSGENMSNLTREGYKYIIGARIKNEAEQIRAALLKKTAGMTDGAAIVFQKKEGVRLVVTYSIRRAKKDAANRNRGGKKLRQQVQSGWLNKQNINNRGYNRFLKMTGETRITIDEEKIESDAKWDGLKGYVTNSLLPADAVADNYRQLWQIENAFRISKTDLKVRPMHHHLRRRIEAHICIAFVAYAIYKELEYQLHKRGVQMSPRRAAELTHNMYELEYALPDSREIRRKILKMDEEQQKLSEVIAKI